MESLDLNIAAPEELPSVLRAAAEHYRESVGELQSAWGDPNAGLIWNKLADTLEAAATQVEKKLARWQP